MLLAGGAAKLPRVQSAVRSLFSEADVGQPDVPPRAAALGAGAQAALLAFRSDGTPVVDRKGRRPVPTRRRRGVRASVHGVARAEVGPRKVQLVPSERSCRSSARAR